MMKNVLKVMNMAPAGEQIDWQLNTKGLLKAELKRRGISYAELADKLREIGVEETPANIANKISRGGFSAVFFFQCLRAIGCHSIRIDDAFS